MYLKLVKEMDLEATKLPSFFIQVPNAGPGEGPGSAGLAEGAMNGDGIEFEAKKARARSLSSRSLDLELKRRGQK